MNGWMGASGRMDGCTDGRMDGWMDGWISKWQEEGLEERRKGRNKDGEMDGWTVGALVSGAGQVEPPDLPRLTGQDQEPSGGIPSSGRLWGGAPNCPPRDIRPQDGSGLQTPCASFCFARSGPERLRAWSHIPGPRSCLCRGRHGLCPLGLGLPAAPIPPHGDLVAVWPRGILFLLPCWLSWVF